MVDATAPIPYWRLSSFYFLYFATLGVMLPYWSLYLEAIGLDAGAIAVTVAIMSATRIFAPNFWGWLADRSGARLRVIRFGAFASLLVFLGLLLRQDPVWIFCVVGLYTFFWNAILSQYEVVTLGSLRGQYHRYGHIRLWGSVSFILAVALCGPFFDEVSVEHLPWLLLAVLACVAAGSLAIRDPGTLRPASRHGSLAPLLRNRTLLAFLAASFLLQLSHGPYYTFFSIFLDRMGFSKMAIGQLWALGVLAEVLVFAVMHRILLRYSLRVILLASLLLAVLRWLMIGLAGTSITALVVAQCLHAATYGSFHAAGVEVVRRHFGEGHQGQGQALYSASSFGAGGALGALLSGVMWAIDPRLSFVAAAGAALLACVIVQFLVRGDVVEAREFSGSEHDGPIRMVS